MKKELVNHYAWVLSGSQRIKIIESLTKPKTPKIISKETDLKFSNVSDCLRALVEKRLVKCLNPENHLGRLYELTKLGERIKEELK